MEADKCPVCQWEYIPGKTNNCPNCAWDVATYRLTFLDQIPKAFLQKERARLDWARQVWARLKSQEEQIKQILASCQAQKNQEQLAEIVALFKQQWQQEVTTVQTQLAEIRASQVQIAASLVQTKHNNQLSTLAQASADNLSSEVGIDYTQLRDFLRDGKWQQADAETSKLILKVSKPAQEGRLQVEDIEKFPCTDLGTIDQLWMKYSNGRFSFSVQKRIWLEVGGTPEEIDDEIWEKFGHRVGWCVDNGWSKSWLDYQDLNFNTNAPEGHLPVGFWCIGRKGASSLAQKLINTFTH